MKRVKTDQSQTCVLFPVMTERVNGKDDMVVKGVEVRLRLS